MDKQHIFVWGRGQAWMSKPSGCMPLKRLRDGEYIQTKPDATDGRNKKSKMSPVLSLGTQRLILLLLLSVASGAAVHAQVAKAPRFRIAKAEQPHFLSARLPVKPIAHGWWLSSRTPQNFCDNQGVLALVILKGDDILFECYGEKVTQATPLFAASMTKTVVGMTMGLVMQDGKIKSVHDRAEDYVPGLKGSLHGAQTIKNLLQMSTGCCRSDPGVPGGMMERMNNEAWFGAGTIAFIRQLNTKEYEPGTKFIYSGTASATLTHIMQEALGSSLVEYFESRVWKPMGAQHGAVWLRDTTGVPMGSAGFLASARDMSRFGLMMARGGVANGSQILPAQWVNAGTTIAPQDEHLRPGAVTLHKLQLGYGYQTWILSSERRQFMMVGYGLQRIAADPKTEVVITVFSRASVTIAARKVAAYQDEFLQLFKAVVSQAEAGEL
jgi:CubicO group peptidase (beta-lactamase class C family)